MPKVIRIERFGGPEVMELRDERAPVPGRGEVLVRHTAIGLNYLDVYHREGHYPLALPSGLGVAGAGIVEALGEGVTGVRRGDRVAYAGIGPGSYAELRTVPEEKLVPLPEGCDDALVAATLQQGITAYFLLHEVYPLKAGDTILFHAAAGGVGTIACQWAQRLGATVIGTAGGADKVAHAAGLGCAAVIDYRHEDVAERVRAITGGTGVAAVFDSVGRDTFEGSLASLRPYGTLVSFGSSSGDPPPLDINRLGEKGSLYLTRPRFVHYARRREDLLRMAQAYFAFLDDPRTQVAIGRRFALAEAADAHRAMQRRETIGSSVLVP